ncbi:MAG TPA: biotin--[acetyl-CoA-carboxylase] ligase [Actinobacteria bacterium]|nr:biotin--[acetyl-CoA-carboxylase] ligase [Actinomycetota bacterium]
MPTKESVLFILKEEEGDYISGADISSRLSLSRTAVWKAVNGLREEGYEIDASPRLGYRLVQVPDLLLPAEIRYSLSTRILGREIYYFDKVVSTNDFAEELAGRGALEGTLVVAERQIGGKGRLGRRWFSPLGGIWISVILRPRISPLDAPKITFLAGVAVADAIGEVTTPTAGEAVIKWPNDVLINDRKVAGILTEMSAEVDRVNFVVLGIGVNANVDSGDFPPDLRPGVVSLSEAVGEKVDRVAILRAVLRRLEEGYLGLQRGEFGPVLNRWRNLCETLGSWVKVAMLEGEIVGEAVDVDEHGGLILRDVSGKERVVHAGDVTVLRKLPHS